MKSKPLRRVMNITAFVLLPIVAGALHAGHSKRPLEAGQSAATDGEAANQVLARDQEFEDAYKRGELASRQEMTAEDYIGIGVSGTVFTKTTIREFFNSGHVKTLGHEVTDRKIRMYGDTAVVTGMRHIQDTLDGKPRDEQHRYTRVWVKRNGKWQIVSFQATTVTDTRPQTAGFEACAAPDGPRTAGSIEQMILSLEDEHSEATNKADSAKGSGWLADDYIGINGRGLWADKAFAVKLYAHGAPTRTEKYSDRRVRVYGDTAIVTGTWCLRQVGSMAPSTGLREGTQEFTGANRFTRVWVKRNGKWEVASWQGSPILPKQELAPGSTAVGQDDANHAQDEAAIRKLIADYNTAFNRHDGSLIVYFTDDAETRRIDGTFFNGKAEIEKLTAALNKSWGNVQRTVTIQRIRFLTPDIALVDSLGEDTGYIVTENGTKLPPPKVDMSFKVVVKKDGRWLITAMRIIAVSGRLAPPGAFLGTGTPNPQAQGVPTTTDDANHAQDEAAIRKILADVDDAWGRQDGKAINAHGSENHDHINVGGAWRQGKVETEKAMTAYFEAHRSNPRSLAESIEKIRFITPDVAILVARNKYSDDKRTWEGISISVLHKMNGEWWNEAFQNTLIQSREEAIAQAARANSPMAQTEPEVITPANSKIDFSGDVAVIRKMVADSVDAWNRRDPTFVTAHVSENHDHINVIGERRQGRAETEKAMTAALATTRNNISSSIAKIRFIAPDVAIVIVRHQYANDKEALKSISTSVLHKMNGEWWSEAFQNTYVQPR